MLATVRVPRFRAHFRAHFFPEFLTPEPEKAFAFWQWTNFLSTSGVNSRKVVHLNMDESSLRLWMPPKVGYRAHRDPGHATTTSSAAIGPSLKQQRAAFSLLAVIASDVEVARLLPQWVLLNTFTCSQKIVTQIADEMTDTAVVFRRGRSAWATTKVLCDWFRAIGQALRPLHASHVFVMCMDAAPAHWTAPVARAAHSAGIRLCFIPPLMTSVLQPLDVHVFQHLKREARDGFEALQIEHTGQPVPVLHILRMWRRLINSIVRLHPWASAFRSCGVGAHQTSAGRRILRALQLEAAPDIPDALPSLSQIQSCTSQRCVLPLVWWFKFAYVARMGHITPDHPEDAAPDPHRPITRSATRSLVADSGASTLAAGPSPARAVWRAPLASARTQIPIASRLWGLPPSR